MVLGYLIFAYQCLEGPDLLRSLILKSCSRVLAVGSQPPIFEGLLSSSIPGHPLAWMMPNIGGGCTSGGAVHFKLDAFIYGTSAVNTEENSATKEKNSPAVLV